VAARINLAKNPADEGSKPIPAIFSDFTAYRHRERGLWIRGDHTVVKNGIFADNAIGVTFAHRKHG
jgi:cell migration-inducing and hyaluronan-binding protein